MKNKIKKLIPISNGLKKILYSLVLIFYALPAYAVKNPGEIFPTIGGGTFQGILLFFVNMLIGLVGLVSIVFLVIGGYQYVISGSSEELAEKGKKTIRNAIIGLIIVILSYSIVVIVGNALEGNV